MRSLPGWFVLIAVAVVLTAATAAGIVAYQYKAARTVELASIDDLLLTRAHGVANAVPASWQDRLERGDAFEPSEYDEICDRLHLLVGGFSGVGVGTAAEKDQDYWITSAVMIPYEGADAQTIPAMTPIVNPSPEWSAAIAQGETLYLSDFDLLGLPVRVVAVSRKTPANDEYAAAGFMTAAEVDRRLDALLLNTIAHALQLALITSPLWVIFLFVLDLQRRRHQARQRELLTVFEAIDEALIAVDQRGIIVELNPVARTLFQEAQVHMAFEDCIGQVANGGETIDPIHEVLSSNDVCEFPDGSTVQVLDGQTIVIAGRATPVHDTEQRLSGVVVTMRDVTEERRMSMQLQQAQKLESIGKLAGGVAHDFNNLLTGILGAAEILGTPVAEDEDQRNRFLNIILQNAKGGAGLTQQLLEFAQRRESAAKPLNVTKLLADLEVLLRGTLAPNISLHFSLLNRTMYINGSETQLQNALLNLAINARDAMAEQGGTLSVAMTVRGKGNDSEVIVTMRDTGPGIPEDILPHVFEPFFTTKPMGKGTGLGLAGVYAAVQNHFGQIELSNHHDGGLEVEIRLPLLDKLSCDQMHEVHLDQTGSQTGYRVLVVDDEEPIRMVLSKQLEQLGYAVVTATDGAEGLALLEDGEVVDAVVLDILMPGLSGSEVFDQLRASRPELPIIVYSGYGGSGGRSADDFLAAGATAVLSKPARLAVLADALRRAVMSSSERAVKS
jgi:C4-dicarboxylate-specific signal transduction histidine kinase/ActR/RegA family two-component response regulator